MQVVEEKNKIGIVMATIAGINAMVGASIFINPAYLQVHVGPAALLIYMGVILAVWFMARALALVAQQNPGEGSFYTYVTTWAGHRGGVIAAGAYIVGNMFALALLAQLTGGYLHDYIPALSSQALSMLVIALFTVLNMVGASLTKAGQVVLVILTLLPMAIIIGMCALRFDIQNMYPLMPHGPMSLLYGVKAVIFGFFGFEIATSLYALVRDPEVNVPRVLTYSILVVGALYMLFMGSIFLALPRSLFVRDDMPLAHILLQVFPQATWLVDALTIGIIVTIMGTIHSLIWGLGALLMGFARSIKMNVQLPMAVASVGTVVAFFCAVISDMQLFFSLTSIFIALAYGMAIVASVVHVRSSFYQKCIGIIGIITAGTIILCGFLGIMSAS